MQLLASSSELIGKIRIMNFLRGNPQEIEGFLPKEISILPIC